MKLEKLNDNARIWIFQSDREMNASEIEKVNEALSRFVPQWAAHGNNLVSEFDIRNGYFILIGVDESVHAASGCSIDALTQQIKLLGAHLGVDFFNRLNVAYEKDGSIHMAAMDVFKKMLQRDEVNQNTIVFNNLVTSNGDLETNWRTPVNKSWHQTLIQVV